MIAIGLGLAWGAYAIGIWGYCLVRGYDVTFAQCMKPTWPASQAGNAIAGAGGAASGAFGDGAGAVGGATA